MEMMSEKERTYMLQETDIIPNRNLLSCMAWAIGVITVCWVLTEAGIFRVERSSMRIGAPLAIFFLLIPQFLRFGGLLNREFAKYVLLSCTAVFIFILATMLMFHTTICLILPMLAGTFYKSRKIGYFSSICSLIITVSSPIFSFVNGMWDSLFLQVLLQFCGIDSAPALAPFFTVTESVSQILLYIVVPRVLIVMVFAIGTMNIIEGNSIALEDRLSLMRNNDKISAMEEDTLECLAAIIESRDGNTGSHVLNTKMYMKLMVDHIITHGLYSDIVDDEYAENVIKASLLHDIGKVSIPDSILNKPGRLTDEEFEIMKTHSIAGDKFIAKAFADNPNKAFVAIAHDIVAFHHEKMNGTGYPYGLEGNSIPLSSRMMAIVDAFDAITSERVYKKAKTVNEAFEILRKDSGTQFDGELVEIFIRSYEEKFGKES